MRKPDAVATVDVFTFYRWVTVRLRSEAGVEGWGQTAYWGFPGAVESTIRELEPLVLGQDPRRVEHLWLRLYRERPFRGGSLSGAVAAIDIALWDLLGKQLEVPVYQLLGGLQRERIRLHRLVGGPGLDELVEACRAARDEGYTAVKFDPLPKGLVESATYAGMLEEAVRRVRAVRDAVGNDVDIIAELHRKLGPGEAVALARELEPFRLYFYEDPIQPDSIEAHREIARQIRIPLGIGERHHTIWEFRDLLTSAAVQFVRPDIGLAGGITHGKKIATLAEAFHAQLAAHNFLSPLLTAATVQLYAAVPNVGTLEYSQESDEEPPSSWLLKEGLAREGGYLVVPNTPGLGVEVDSSRFDAFADLPAFTAKSTDDRPDGSMYTR